MASKDARNPGDFLADAGEAATCTICGSSFMRLIRSRREVCSAECKRERALRYGAAYRQMGRDLRAQLLAGFGGRKPTGEEILALIRGKGDLND